MINQEEFSWFSNEGSLGNNRLDVFNILWLLGVVSTPHNDSMRYLWHLILNELCDIVIKFDFLFVILLLNILSLLLSSLLYTI